MSLQRFISKYWRYFYSLTLVGMLVMYPIFVSDGQSWKYLSEYDVQVPVEYQIHGIDISRHNGEIDWDKINEDRDEHNIVQFIFIKATEGGDLVDKNFETNWDNAKIHGFVRGAYHFFTPYTDPKLQALNFILTVKHEKGDLVPVLDFENNGKTKAERDNLANNVRIWLETVEKHLGVKPIIYTNRPIFRLYIKGQLEDYPLWISDYVSDNLKDFETENLILWQHSAKGKIPGINSDVDFNVFMGTPFKFKKFIL